MPSIEILVERPTTTFHIDLNGYTFAVKCTDPPVSDRSPSLWQNRFAQHGGLLVHMGEARFKGNSPDWFYAHDLIEERKCVRFRFKPQYKPCVVRLLRELTSHSDSHTIHFTTDWQFGPKSPNRETTPLTLSEFLVYHDSKGIRFNSWLTIKERCP